MKTSASLLDTDVNWENVRILAVDDNAEMRDQYKSIFEQLNIDYDILNSGSEAIGFIDGHGLYDIYFIDWHLSDMDGVELTRHIRTLEEGRLSAIIIVSEVDWELIKADAMTAGINKHLSKPILSSGVIDVINECLGSARHQDELKEFSEDEFKGKKLLIVEDIEINREILISLLDKSGLIIDCAEDGKEALDMIIAAPDKYDIIFMDMQMPVMDGLEATRCIRALPEVQELKHKLPIVAMTANVFKDDIDACISAGMDDHIGKPLDLNRVLSKLRKYLT
jgi:CheY-like chemotaxis protein